MSPIARAFMRSPSALHTHFRTSPLRTFKLFSFYSAPHRARYPLLVTRSVASSVSNKPGSQTFPHAAQNIREETGNSAKDLAKTIAGNISFTETVVPKNDSFLGITSIIASTVPKHILVMGLAGALPYLGTSLTTVYLAREASLAASGALMNVDPTVALAVLQNCLNIQVTYGAILISFSAALHWGFEFAAYNGTKGYPRLLLGVVPVVYAWSTLALDPVMALVAQWVGYTGLWFVDMKATSAGWTPKWYSQYRFYLSVLVGTCIIGTLGATSYLGPTPGHDLTHRSLEELRAKRRVSHGDFAEEVPGPVAALPTGDLGDAYVKIETKDEGEGKD
ncbi:hypothetical protein K439DRAFT_159477 [Ramaria rubella]|nr:hypothetical protein K439DRAFT_159477 [Ramaria rubella]